MRLVLYIVYLRLVPKPLAHTLQDGGGLPSLGHIQKHFHNEIMIIWTVLFQRRLSDGRSPLVSAMTGQMARSHYPEQWWYSCPTYIRVWLIMHRRMYLRKLMFYGKLIVLTMAKQSNFISWILLNYDQPWVIGTSCSFVGSHDLIVSTFSKMSWY